MFKTCLALALFLLLAPTVWRLQAAPPDTSHLIRAIRNGEADEVRRLIAGRTDVNTPTADGSTALHWAVYEDRAEIVRALLRAGAAVDAANDLGVTALMLSCATPGAATLEMLLEAGANPNLSSKAGDTPLMACARSGNAAGAKALLDRRADTAATDQWLGQTALMHAAANAHTEVAALLVTRGADVSARSKSGFTPLLFAAREGSVAIADAILASGARVNEASRDGSTPLLVAVVRGHAPLVRWLLERGADPNAAAGYAPLHWIAGSWHSELTGPNGIDVTRDAQWTRMGGWPQDLKLEIASALIARGANLNARLTRNPPQFGYTSGRFKIGMAGATPFFLAAMDGNIALMKVLVAAGADPLLTTEEQTTALMVAAGLGRVPAESLVSDGATLETVRLVLELGGDVHAVNDDGNTALHGAAHIRLEPLIQLLVDRGARVNARNGRGLTPLMVAEGSGHSDNPGLAGGPAALLLKKLGAQ